ncbi:40S ribosomal protein S5, putative [Hepatocystis sp. ex Piliocolobus tephrosceles]|nr:40S ribosomal protein S5, putative [Hepatocystis sp. ex Piliocolobus tephrosceles]
METTTSDIKLFKKWSYEDINIADLSLVDCIAISQKACVYTPHTAGRYQKKRFRKALCPIVERLVNSMMMHGRNNGKKLKAIKIVAYAFEIIHLMTGKNPLQVFVDALIMLAFRNIKTISECLAEEIIHCANESASSYAIKKKDEIERVAKANR